MRHQATIRAIGLGAIGAASIWPYVGLIGFWPTSRDAIVWIVRGAGSDWLGWAFATRHFNIGYRPLTALSYSFDTLLGGFAAPVYRMTDLMLHVACVVMVGVAFRRMWPERSAWGALVAAAIFALHPVVENVMPELARRSYVLATLFALIAVVVAAGATTNRRALAAGALAACALLSHELGVAVVAAVLLLCGRAIVAVPVAIAITLRWAVAAGVGGYNAAVEWPERVLPIIGATWRVLGGRLRPIEPSAPEPFFVAAVFGVALFYLWRALEGRAFVVVVWFGLLFVLFLPQGVWFPRQVYPMLAPMALIGAVALVDAVAQRRWVFVAPQAAVIGLLVFASPLVHGMDVERSAAIRETDRVMRQTIADLEPLDSTDRVQLVLPSYADEPRVHALRARKRTFPLGLRVVEQWAAGTVDDAPALSTIVIYDSTARPRPTLDDGDELILHRPATSRVFADGSVATVRYGGALRLARPRSEDGRAFVYIHDTTSGRLIRVDRP